MRSPRRTWNVARRLHAAALALAASLILPLAVSAQATPRAGSRSDVPDGAILSSAEYRLPPYDSLPEAQRRELDETTTRAAYEATRRESRFVLRRVRYASDGLGVIAYTYLPRATSGARRPVVVFARGSFVAGDLAPVLAPRLRRLALAGYTVVAPQYRGSDGGEGRDEMGGADVADVHNALRLARRLPGVDTSRVFLYGESRGGMMVYQALRDGAAVRAAAVVGAFTDLDSLLAGDPWSRRASATLWPTYEHDRTAIATPRSALRWADRLHTPLLLLHGGADPQVSPRQAMLLAAQLDANKVPYSIHVIAGAGHTLSAIEEEREALVTRWFEHWGASDAGALGRTTP